MSKKRTGLRKVLPAIVAVFMLTFVMLCSVLPAGAYEVTANMLRDVQQFFETEDDFALNRETLEAYAQSYLADKFEGDEKLDELNKLLVDENGEQDFSILLDLLGVNANGDDSVTIGAALDVLRKVSSVDQLIYFVKVQQGYLEVEEAPTYTVQWQANGQTVTQTYRHYDVFNYPTKAEMGLVSGEYISWDCGAFFVAPTYPQKVTVITGTVSNLAQELTDLSDGITSANGVFKAVIDEETHQVVLALSVSENNYLDVLSYVLNNENRDELKAEIKDLMYDVAAAGINAGVNDITVNGYHILQVEDYGLDHLVEVLDQLADGEVSGLVSTTGVKEFLLNEDYSMHRFTHMSPVTVNGVTYESFGDYEVKLSTDGLPESTWTVSFAFEGDTTNLVQICKWVEEVVAVERIDGGVNIRFDLTNEKLQLVLKKAYESSATPEELRNLISRFVTADGDYFYVIDASMTVSELKDIVRHADYDHIIEQLTGRELNVNEREKFQEVLDLALEQIPARFDNLTMGELYDGDHLFSGDATRDMGYFEDICKRLVKGYSFFVAGRELNLEDLVEKVFAKIDVSDVYIKVDAYMGDYRLYYVDNGGTIEDVFMRPGMDLSVLFGNVPEMEGHDLVYLYNGQVITTTPDVDVSADAPITYEYRVRGHELTIEILLKDSGAPALLAGYPDGTVLTVKVNVPYGTEINDAFILDAIKDQLPEGYEIVSLPEATTMPDGNLTLSVECERIYFTITWIVDGVQYAQTSVAWGDVPAIEAPTKEADLNYVYTLSAWSPAVEAAYADATYEATFEATSRYEDESIGDNVIFGKDEENNDITIDVVGPNGEGIPEIDVPLGPVIEEMKKDPTLGLQYTHNFGDGYFMEIDFTADEMQHIIAELDKILEEKGLTYDDVSIHTSREETEVGGKPAVKYDVTFRVDGEDEIIAGNGGNTVRVNVDALTDPEKEYVVYVKDAEGNLIEVPFETVGTDENGNPIIEFTTPIYGEIYVVEETKEYPVEITPSENGSVTVDPENAAKGETVTITVTPNTGYVVDQVDQVIVTDKDGNPVVVTKVSDTEYTFTQPSGGATVEVTFKLAEYTVTFKYEDENGEHELEVTVKHGDPAPAAPVIPTTWSNETYRYTFAFWVYDGDSIYDELDVITSDLIVTAEYDSEKIEYVINFQYRDENGEWVYTPGEGYYYGATIEAPVIPTTIKTLTTIYTFTGWDKALTVVEDYTFVAQYSESDRYPEGGDVIVTPPDPDDPDPTLELEADASADNSVVIPMGPIFEETLKNEDLNVRIRVNFADGYYMEVFFTAEEMAAIREQIDALLADGQTYEDVELYVSRKAITTPEGDTAYAYDLTFRVNGEDVSLKGHGGNTVTVNVPEASEGHEYKVYVKNPVTGEYEKVEHPVIGKDVISFTTPYYTEIEVVEERKTYTVTFYYRDKNGDLASYPASVKYGDTVEAPTNIPGVYVNLYQIGTFLGTWTGDVSAPVTGSRRHDAMYVAEDTYDPNKGLTLDYTENTIKVIIDNATNGGAFYFAPLLKELKDGLSLEHTLVVDGYELNIFFSDEAAEHETLKNALQAAIAEIPELENAFYEIVLATSREVVESADHPVIDGYQVNAVYKYTVTFKAVTDDGVEYVLAVKDLTPNTLEADVDYGAYSQFEVLSNGENIFTGAEGGKVTFETNHYSEFLVVDKTQLFTVTFVDHDGTVLKVQENVPAGTAATAPAAPTRKGYTFTGWDVAFNCIVEDTTVTAQYKVNGYTVIFKDWDDRVISAQTLDYGTAITAPVMSNDKNAAYVYTFAGWRLENGTDLVEVTATVEGDVTYVAVYDVTNREEYPEGGDVTVDQDRDGNKVIVEGDATGDNEIDIPMGPILEEGKATDIRVEFDDGYYIEIELTEEEVKNILDQITEKGIDPNEVTLHVSRTEEDGKVVYEVVFEDKNGDPIDITATQGGNNIRVNVDGIEDGYEYVVKVGDTEIEGTVGTDENGDVVIDFSIPEYSEIEVSDRIKTYDVTFTYIDKNGNWVSATVTFEHGQALVIPENAYNKVLVTGKTYTLNGWLENDVLVELPATVTEAAAYTADYTEESNGVAVEKDDDQKTIDITVGGENGPAEIEIPFDSILDDLKNGYQLTYRHEFGDGYYLEIDFDEDLLIAALDEALAADPDAALTLYTARAVVTEDELRAQFGDDFETLFEGYDITKIYKYSITFKADSDALALDGLNNSHRVNVDYDADSDYTVVSKDNNGESEKTDTDIDATVGGEGRGEVGFDSTHYSDFFVVEMTKKTYEVIFGYYDAEGNFVQLGETQIIEHGEAAVEPDTTREGYTFKNWDVDFSNVTGNLTVIAEYEINKYTVIFKDHDGTQLGEAQTVEYGKGATAPAAPTHASHTFKNWDVDFSNVTSDLTVTAVCEINKYTVIFKDHDGTQLGE
ncbi:MAG: InlB B-repeat-containing protein, partial [Clostridia bacterium]|nr:InlB B-repeat-containing protein [Clostridia bacterium]